MRESLLSADRAAPPVQKSKLHTVVYRFGAARKGKERLANIAHSSNTIHQLIGPNHHGTNPARKLTAPETQNAPPDPDLKQARKRLTDRSVCRVITDSDIHCSLQLFKI